MPVVVLGRSVRGRTIEGNLSSRGAVGGTLIFGGFHGDEPKSVFVARKLLELLESRRAPKEAVRARGPGEVVGAKFRKAAWMIVPLVNPDGYALRKRRNARGVDINRNFPTENWVWGSERSRMFGGRRPASEPETRAVIRAVEEFRPAWIITIHSISGGRECNNYDGPGRMLARRMSRGNGYPVTATIGYPTPGSFGAWAGAEQGIATITLELPSRDSPRRCWEMNRSALLKVIVQGL